MGFHRSSGSTQRVPAARKPCGRFAVRNRQTDKPNHSERPGSTHLYGPAAFRFPSAELTPMTHSRPSTTPLRRSASHDFLTFPVLLRSRRSHLCRCQSWHADIEERQAGTSGSLFLQHFCCRAENVSAQADVRKRLLSASRRGVILGDKDDRLLAAAAALLDRLAPVTSRPADATAR